MPAYPHSPTGPASVITAPGRSDVVIAGAGIIGLALALELDRRGARVTVLEAGGAMQQSSSAAAGMLAVDDPHNPAALLPLSRLSAQLYPDFLARIAGLSGMAVPFQTDTTIQYFPEGTSKRLAEHSLDPRQLAQAMTAAVRATRIELREHTALERSKTAPGQATAITGQGSRFTGSHLVYATGAWPVHAGGQLPVPIAPRKGQMLRVRLAPRQALLEVHRSQSIYVVPRHHGPQAGTALIGATVEEAGFDTATHAGALTHLRALAAALLPGLPALADPAATPAVEAWAGLRPGTPDQLPLLGPLDASGSGAVLVATGHFRNGILLAPATAAVLADLIEHGRAALDLSAFAPLRFARH